MGRPTSPAMSESAVSEDELTEFVYTDLHAPHAVRLLKLQPGGRKAGEIVCELVEEDLAAESSEGGKIEYEALSWSWGNEPWVERIQIHRKGENFFSHVPRSLALALRALRDRRAVRTLWVDAICINQKKTDEKNKQVPMMSKIYGGASRVCIWLGEGDPDGSHKVALDFIKDEVLRLQSFDELCDDPQASPKWRAMLNLMKRPWFSRRWVVQEIALAADAIIYCGKETIQWKDFADAVQLFVEVETATHRLSEVMKKDPKFYNVPGWFEYVSALGASLLIHATSNLFRTSKDHNRQPLLSLDYLVSSLSVFEATEPRDTIYSLLPIAKDTSPIAVVSQKSQSSAVPALAQLGAWADRHMRAKRYKVDYNQPLIDIYKEFILFSIRQSDQETPSRALDIICRPWAPSPIPKKREGKDAKGKRIRQVRIRTEENGEPPRMPSWIPGLAGAAHAMYTHANGEVKMGRQNADALVGLPGLVQGNYSAAGTTRVNMNALKFKKRKTYYSMYVQGFVFDEVAKVEVASQGGNIPEEWLAQAGWEDTNEDPPQEFWRTLVADRGRHGRNPPTFYGRACKESITKGLTAGSLNTTELINDGRCSVIAEFFRRVQAVIWNRSLMRTKNGDLGMVRKDVEKGDLICILNGCSVPVILREHRKAAVDVAREQKEDEAELAQIRERAAIRIQKGYRESVARRATLKEERLARMKEQYSGKQQGNFAAQANRSLPADQQHPQVPEEEDKPIKESWMLTSINGLSEGTSKSNAEQNAEAAVVNLNGSLPAKLENGGPSNEEARRDGERRLSRELDRRDNSSIKNPKLKPKPKPGPKPEPKLKVPSELKQKQGETDTKNEATEPGLADDSRYLYYELVGGCYVHGMMDGEAIKYQNFKEIKPRIFELR